jgi:hypothetical protein
MRAVVEHDEAAVPVSQETPRNFTAFSKALGRN